MSIRRVSILILALSLAAMGGCAKSAFDAAMAENKISSLKEFLEDHPDSEFSSLARNRMKVLQEELDLERLSKMASSEAYEAFLKDNPDSDHTEEVLQKIEDLVFAEANYRYQETFQTAAHTSKIYDVLVHGGDVVSAGIDRDVKFRSLKTGKQTNTIYITNRQPVYSLDVTPDGVSLLGGSDRLMKWNLETGELETSLVSNQREMRAIVAHPDGKIAVTGNRANSSNIDVWNIQDFYLVETLKGHTLEINALVFSPTGDRFYSGSSDRTVMAWDAVEYEPIETYKLKDKINGLAISPDGETLYYCGRGGNEIGRIHLSDGKVEKIGHHRDSVNDIVLSADGKYLISVGEDSDIYLWDVESGKKLDEFSANGPLGAVDITEDGEYFVVTGVDLNLYIFKRMGGKHIHAYAKQQFDEGDLARAEKVLTRGVESETLEADGYLLLAKIQIINEDFDGGLESLKAANKLRSGDDEILYEVAKAYERRGQEKDDRRAIAIYKRIYKMFGRSKEGGRAKEKLDEYLGEGWEQREKR